MLIDGGDISNDVITLGTCFSMFVYVRGRFRFVLIGGDLTAQSPGCHRRKEGGIQNSRLRSRRLEVEGRMRERAREKETLLPSAC